MVNEEFTSIRQKLFRNDATTDSGSHHSIAYGDFERSAAGAGFDVKYFVAHHVRKALERNLTTGLGNLIATAIEMVPISLKQLNSALVLLRKEAAAIPVAETEVSPCGTVLSVRQSLVSD